LLTQGDEKIFASLGEDVTYEPQTGLSLTIRGMWNDNFGLLSGAGVIDLVDVSPGFTCRKIDLSNPRKNDKLVRDSKRYRVLSHKSDDINASWLLELDYVEDV